MRPETEAMRPCTREEGTVGNITKTTRLARMGQMSQTVLWNDSCSMRELASSIESNGAVGATCNPVIVLEVLRKEWDVWKDRVPYLIQEYPRASEGEIAWRVTEEMSRKAAALLRPAFERSNGRNGRLSIQVDPKAYRNPEALVEQAERFAQLAPNIIVKIPATQRGDDRHRRSHLPRDQHQCDGQLYPASGAGSS